MSETLASQRCKSLRQLLIEILQYKFSLEELHSFHLLLELPKRLLDASAFSVAILRVLGERNTIREWSSDPAELISILEKNLHRSDLASMVQRWSGTTFFVKEY